MIWIGKAMDKLKSKNGRYISNEKEIFYRHVQMSDDDSCWEWTAYKKPSGYGQTRIGGRGGKHYLAHRLSWIVHFGDIPDGMHVCHKCDNPPCVNPKHLFLGTNSDNIKDRVSKGRSRPAWKGVDREKHPSCKFTHDDVLKMVSLRKSGHSIPKIAPLFNISTRHVSILTSKYMKET
jgi:hypothetical protein